MGYWKCSASLYFTPVMRKIGEPIHAKDGFASSRESIFFKLLSLCANDNFFSDAAQFARFTSNPRKQCEYVWEICLEHGVLRESDLGYSAIEWMDENGLLPTSPSSNTTRTRTKSVKPQQSKQEVPKQENEPEKIEDKASNDNVVVGVINPEFHEPERESHYRGKIIKGVRENVSLSPLELDLLKAEYSDEAIDLMLDKLSEYKITNKREYRSDYQAIIRWVTKWLNTMHPEISAKKKSQDNPSARVSVDCPEFPSWLTGAN